MGVDVGWVVPGVPGFVRVWRCEGKRGAVGVAWLGVDAFALSPAPLPQRGRGENTRGMSSTVGWLPSPACGRGAGGEGLGERANRPSTDTTQSTPTAQGTHIANAQSVPISA